MVSSYCTILYMLFIVHCNIKVSLDSSLTNCCQNSVCWLLNFVVSQFACRYSSFQVHFCFFHVPPLTPPPSPFPSPIFIPYVVLMVYKISTVKDIKSFPESSAQFFMCPYSFTVSPPCPFPCPFTCPCPCLFTFPFLCLLKGLQSW